MANEMRDRLYGLLGECEKKYSAYYEEFIRRLDKAETQADFEKIYDGIIKKHDFFADYLIANGVVVMPCKVGDKTFLLLEKINGGYDVVESKCVRITDNGYGKYYSMSIDCKEIGNTLECGICDFGKWVFLTKEEAEQKLKEMRGNWMARCKHYVEAFDCCAKTSEWVEGLLDTASCYYRDDENPNCRYFEEAEDVVPVVRCGECEHFKEYPIVGTSIPSGWGKCMQISMDIDLTINDYCNYGERRCENE